VRLFLAGQRQELTLLLSTPTESDAVALARERHRERSDLPALHVSDDGRVSCRYHGGRRYTPPYFHGRLGADGGEVTLTGVIRESRNQGFTTVIYSVLAVFMAAVAVFCAVVQPIVVPGLVICGIAALAFGALSLAVRRMRVTQFRADAPKLEAALSNLFDSGYR
jgi:hypothetical protein